MDIPTPERLVFQDATDTAIPDALNERFWLLHAAHALIDTPPDEREGCQAAAAQNACWPSVPASQITTEVFGGKRP